MNSKASNCICYVYGDFVPLNEARIPITDLSIMRGYAVFDTLRTYNCKPFELRAHIRRLLESARIIKMPKLPNGKEVEEVVLQTLEKNVHLNEAVIRLILSGKEGEGMHSHGAGLMVIITPLPNFNEHYYKCGINVISTPLQRAYAKAKTTNYISAMMALNEVRGKEVFEAIYIDEKGVILEATTGNFFMFKNDVLCTPKNDGILEGITRKVVMQLAKKEFKVQECDLTLEDVKNCQGAFITASNKEIMPIHQFDDIELVVCKQTKRLQEMFAQMTKNY